MPDISMPIHPKKIDQYNVIREIGRGGMGYVYLCRDTEIGRDVALKVMREDGIRPPRDIDRQRFVREALTTARLQHPGIPPVFCVKKCSEGRLYYAMKLIEGTSLDDILKGLKADNPDFVDKFSNHALVKILTEVSKTLHYSHSEGYLHRDLKPSNIFVGDYGEVYLIDWGLTKKMVESLEASDDSTLFEEITIDEETKSIAREALINYTTDEDQLTLQGDLLGTPAYMPPEQTMRKRPELTPGADIYSLGVILYRMLTLRLPIETKDLKHLVRNKRLGNLPHPDDIAPERDIPPELAAIAMQAMETAPTDRFETVRDFQRSLEFWMEGKTQYRRVDIGEYGKDKFIVRPAQTSNRWIMNESVVKTKSMGKGQMSRLFFRRAFDGDIRLSMNIRLLHVDESSKEIRRFGVMFRSSEPVAVGSIDQYSLIFAGNNNTRLTLYRNGTEIASNENIIFEPDKKYHVVIETHQGELKVSVNARLVLSIIDRSPLTGAWIGFIHHGQPVIYSHLLIMTRGLPITTETIQIPEALMAEGCYDGARRRFMEIYRNHPNRFVGAWAAYRAGVAAFRASRRRSDAIRIWAQLRGHRYSDLEKLGLARLDLIENRPVDAANQLQRILNNKAPAVILDHVADFAQEHTQNLLRKEQSDNITWNALDRWIRLTLALDQSLQRHDPITLSLLWRWLFQTITSHPQYLGNALTFMRETYGEGRGEFCELITNETQLNTLIQRSLSMKNHTFLLEKLMRLIIWHEDSIEDLETLGRFYLNSGHEVIALQIFQQLIRICYNSNQSIPPAPLAYVGCYLWLNGQYKEARKTFKMLHHDSQTWGSSDAQFFLGLDDYRLGRRLNAVQKWKAILENSQHKKEFRCSISRALLGEVGPDPDEASVPDRHDYRFLFYFFVGLRYLIDYQNDQDEKARTTAIQLFKKVQSLMKPSYNIYASTESFARLPLEILKAPLPFKEKPEVLSTDEKNWIKILIMTIKNEVISAKHG